ncbi:MAG TPA: hypothetical protein DCY35_08805 [Prolixibacteraceae bacterium]|nr:hypothetical protein [Prolixibacteraceae bacterium]
MEKSVKILLLEDLPSDAQLAKYELKKVFDKMEIRLSDNEPDFLKALDEFQPDIVISDYQMPAFDGMTALKIVLEKSPMTPVILLTGSMNEDTAVECMKTGAADYVIKEHIKRLGQAVLSALEQKEIRIQKNETQRLLEESEKQYRNLFETMAQGVIYQDYRGRIFRINRSAENILGYSEEMLTTRISDITVWEAIREDGTRLKPEDFPSMVALRKGREVRDVIGFINPKTEKYTWIRVNSKPEYRNGEEQPFQVYSTMEDITHLKELLIELNDLNQDLEKRVEERTNEIFQLSKLQQAILGNAGLGIFSATPEGTIQLFNPAAEQMLGYTSEEVTGKETPLLFHDTQEIEDLSKRTKAHKNELATPYFNLLVNLLDGQDSFTREMNFKRKDGTRFPGKLTLSTYSDESGNIIGIIGIIMDITLERQAIESLRKSETENRAILDAVPDVLFRLNQKGDFIYSHFSDSNQLFTLPDNYLGKNIIEVLPADIASLSLEKLCEAFQTKETVTFEYSLERNGNIQYFENRIIALSNQEALSIIRDITERNLTMAALQWNESLMKMMTATSPLAFLVIDHTNDDIVFFNHRYCEIWGLTEKENEIREKRLKNNDLIKYCQLLIAQPRFVKNAYRPLEDIDNREIIEDVIPFVDGRYIRRYSAQIRGLEDEYFGRLYIFEDITEKESLSQSLIEAVEREKELNEMKSKFVSMASHEFRTPLASILMATETMENYFDRMNKEELQKYLQRIRKNIEFLREMINKFLNLSRIETGKMPYMPEPTEITGFINIWIEEFSIKNSIKQTIRFEKAFDEAILTIDRQLMLQVFDNLVTNSIKYSPEDGVIAIRVEKLEDRFRFIFEDKGIGIPKKDQGKLFEAFFRASNTGNIHGTGLGLPLVKQIVERHDGKVWFESVENEGTTFYVEIPCNIE